MLLANTNLRKKNIVAIYDSDARKTGCTLMEMPIHPFTPMDAAQNKVNALLLTTYSAQKNILNYLKSIDYKGKVYTLYDFS